ncbi:hypothetical protein [Arthrobacter sp. CAN_A1]|uniref:hypothetical protein n=1 Tax=Arthrobacter sp. CAN_A1 TaxID=2787717 RepID=UPI0018C98DD0
MGGAIVTVLCGARYPLAAMAGMFLAAGVITGVLADDFATPLSISAIGFVAASSSLVVHESAHLGVLRRFTSDPAAGQVHCSATEVWVAGQTPDGLGTAVTAVVGPAAGAAYLLILSLAGVPQWIAVSLAVIHVINLLPWFPDGKQLKLGLAQLLLERVQPQRGRG